MIMTDNLKKTLVILLDTYKEDKIDKEDILTILEQYSIIIVHVERMLLLIL